MNQAPRTLRKIARTWANRGTDPQPFIYLDEQWQPLTSRDPLPPHSLERRILNILESAPDLLGEKDIINALIGLGPGGEHSVRTALTRLLLAHRVGRSHDPGVDRYWITTRGAQDLKR